MSRPAPSTRRGTRPAETPAAARRRHLLTWTAVVLLSLVLAQTAYWVYTNDTYWSQRWTVDLTVYMASGETVREGKSLYDLVVMSPLYGEMPYLYPPMTALLFFVPLSFLPVAAASFVWNAASLVALGAVIRLTLGIAGVRDGRARSVLTLVGLLLAACLLPVRMLLIAGQINMFLLLLVLLDFRGRPGRWQGIGIGIAAGLKVTPLIFIVYLLATRRWRSAGNALGAFAVTVGVGFAVLPSDAARYWGGLVLHSSRAGGVFDTPNQSLAGALARVLSGAQYGSWWLAVMALVGLWGIAVAVHAFRHGADFLGFSATAVTGLLVSPVSWEHHWVYVIPLLVWLAVRAHRDRSLTLTLVTALLVTVFTVRVFMLVGIQESPPAPMALAAWEQVAAALFPLTGLALLAFGPFWVRRHRPADGGPAGADRSAGPCPALAPVRKPTAAGTATTTVPRSTGTRAGPSSP